MKVTAFGVSEIARIGLLSIALTFALASGGCDDDGGSRDNVPRGRLPKTTSLYRRTGCLFRLDPSQAVECGVITVPEHPGEEDGAKVELSVARFFVLEGKVPADPVVLLTGGPGQDATQLAAQGYTQLARLTGGRDLVAIDQRGTGTSAPSLACPETDDATDETRGAALEACRARVIASGHDPAAFTTANNAADIALARKALGYREWNLFGVSYGTRLALTVLRDHPEGIRSVVLSSVVPLEADLLGDLAGNAERAFQRVFASCAADAACVASHPDLEARFHDVVHALDTTPGQITVGGEVYAIRGSDLVDFLFQLLYDASSIAYVPLIIDDAIAGDFTIVASVLEGGGVGGSISYGMHLSAQCAEELPFTTLATTGLDVDPLYRDVLLPTSYEADCLAWKVPAASAIENQPVVSDVPTLLISGGYDPVTPPEYAALVAA